MCDILLNSKTKHRNHKAFTLAEVLITLSIIGVIAAITIPTLISNYQKQTTVVKLKKVYSILDEAVKRSEIENGEITTWESPVVNYDVTESTAWWNTYFIPYSKLSVIKSCSASKYKECWSENSKFLDGKVMSTGLFYQVLADGTAIAYNSVGKSGGQIYVDLNGMSAPNVVGKDIFYFLINSNHTKRVGMGASTFTRDELLSCTDNACCNKTPGTFKGAYCGQVILLDGWQISKEYPW